jgi:hypothetical protein
MISKLKDRHIDATLCVSRYESELYKITVTIDKKVIQSIQLEPKKYLLPDILITSDVISGEVDGRKIMFDYSMILGSLNEQDLIIENIQKSKSFVESELIPFLKNLIK